MLFVRHRLHFPMVLFAISEQQLHPKKLQLGCSSDGHTSRLGSTSSGREVKSAVSECESDACWRAASHERDQAVNQHSAAAAAAHPALQPKPHRRILSAFGICRIAAWLAIIQTSSAFVLVLYCWSGPSHLTSNPYFGAVVMVAVLLLHLLFLFWPRHMEADARRSMRSSLKRCLMAGFVKYRLLDNVRELLIASFFVAASKL
jgi:hypothetical protein